MKILYNDLKNIITIIKITVILFEDQLTIDLNEKNSPIILIEGGIGEFPIHIKNHIIIAVGVIENILLLTMILRDLEFL